MEGPREGWGGEASEGGGSAPANGHARSFAGAEPQGHAAPASGFYPLPSLAPSAQSHAPAAAHGSSGVSSAPPGTSGMGLAGAHAAAASQRYPPLRPMDTSPVSYAAMQYYGDAYTQRSHAQHPHRPHTHQQLPHHYTEPPHYPQFAHPALAASAGSPRASSAAALPPSSPSSSSAPAAFYPSGYFPASQYMPHTSSSPSLASSSSSPSSSPTSTAPHTSGPIPPISTSPHASSSSSSSSSSKASRNARFVPSDELDPYLIEVYLHREIVRALHQTRHIPQFPEDQFFLDSQEHHNRALVSSVDLSQVTLTSEVGARMVMLELGRNASQSMHIDTLFAIEKLSRELRVRLPEEKIRDQKQLWEVWGDLLDRHLGVSLSKYSRIARKLIQVCASNMLSEPNSPTTFIVHAHQRVFKKAVQDYFAASANSS
eukprot:TRINITY_DN470_c2_g2_i1.p1 TRINITY_DN470_c2_g2~~TRINITY_DN470_c2_g2_i1.p1  ORF type:complete len:429 (-),score=148.98 TRINITY_DN470_c2_g2_i1:192-1478(-)